MASRRGLPEEEWNDVLFFQDSDAQSEQSDVVDVESDVESDYDMHQSDEFVGDESDSDGEAITIQLADEPVVWQQDQNRSSSSRVQRNPRVQRCPTNAFAPVHRATTRASTSRESAPSTSRYVESVPSTSRETPPSVRCPSSPTSSASIVSVYQGTTPRRSPPVARSARLAMGWESSSPTPVRHESLSESCNPITPGASDRPSFFSQAVPLPRMCMYSYHIFISILNLCIY